MHARVPHGARLWPIAHEADQLLGHLIRTARSRTRDGPRSTRSKRSNHALELKYAPDLELHGHAREEASARGADLKEAFLIAGWGITTIHPVVVGNADTITSETMNCFNVSGICISQPTSLKLAKQLAIDSIKRTAELKRARLSRAAGDPHAMQATGPATFFGP